MASIDDGDPPPTGPPPSVNTAPPQHTSEWSKLEKLVSSAKETAILTEGPLVASRTTRKSRHPNRLSPEPSRRVHKAKDKELLIKQKTAVVAASAVAKNSSSASKKTKKRKRASPSNKQKRKRRKRDRRVASANHYTHIQFAIHNHRQVWAQYTVPVDLRDDEISHVLPHVRGVNGTLYNLDLERPSPTPRHFAHVSQIGSPREQPS